MSRTGSAWIFRTVKLVGNKRQVSTRIGVFTSKRCNGFNGYRLVRGQSVSRWICSISSAGIQRTCLQTLNNRIFIQVEIPTSNDGSVPDVLVPVFIIDDFMVANANGRRIGIYRFQIGLVRFRIAVH